MYYKLAQIHIRGFANKIIYINKAFMKSNQKMPFSPTSHVYDLNGQQSTMFFGNFLIFLF